MKKDTQQLLRHWQEAVPDDRLAHLVRDTARAYTRALQARLAQHQVPFGHWAFLRILWHSDGLTQRELSVLAGVMEPTTFSAMKAMEALGYIERRQAPENKKNMYVYLTPQGRADSRVKVMGELIDVEAIEKRFLELAQGAIREGAFALIPIPDPRRENALIAVFEGYCPEEIIATYQSQAPGPERFSRWIAIESFPRTDLGKLRREEFRRMVL
jgi:DNA-binding MarR family transcriptional regulator